MTTFQDDMMQQVQLLAPFFVMTTFVVVVILNVISRLGGDGKEENKETPPAQIEGVSPKLQWLCHGLHVHDPVPASSCCHHDCPPVVVATYERTSFS